MVNLLARGTSNGSWACIDGEPGGRVEARILRLAELVHGREFAPDGAAFRDLESELEELAGAPSRIAALALLESIDGLRRVPVGKPPTGEGLSSVPVARPPEGRAVPLADGDWVLHRPGRSLATGEAEIASRGYFDVEDRPPIGAWVALLVSAAQASGDDALAIAAWVAPKDVERAKAGCRACPNGALAMLSEQAPEIHARLRAIESRASRS